jgi:hypothetical protein
MNSRAIHDTEAPSKKLQVVLQPPRTYYTCREGPLHVVFRTNGDDDLRTACVQLLYEKTYAPVDGEEPMLIIASSMDKDTIHYRLKINQISKNHQGMSFCLAFAVGGRSIVTQGFLVRTKRTATTIKRVQTDTNYQIRSRAVLTSLQWYISGYVSNGDGVAYPEFSCPLCKQTQQAGHTAVCAIMLLIQ